MSQNNHKVISILNSWEKRMKRQGLTYGGTDAKESDKALIKFVIRQITSRRESNAE